MANAFSVCVPTRNAGAIWNDWLEALGSQKARPKSILVIDSSSTDGSGEAARAVGAEVIEIPVEVFNHGRTRQMGVEVLHDSEIIVFLTQDAVLASPVALRNLIAAFDDPLVGAVYGRQLPRINSGAIEAHARIFNYPEKSRVVSMADVPQLGIRAAFLSNSFAAYRRMALQAVGGFQSDIILGEDTIVAARMLNEGWKIAYRADAQVYHSHSYSPFEEFRRYFDTGVLHRREAWLVDGFGKASGEGMRYVLSEIRYLCSKAPLRIPEALVRNALKLSGYRIGQAERYISRRLKRWLSLHKGYWDEGGARNRFSKSGISDGGHG